MLQAGLRMESDGGIMIPAFMRAELGWQEGAKLLARLVDGTIVLEHIINSIRRAQASVRQYIPGGSGSVDAFISERRKAAENE